MPSTVIRVPALTLACVLGGAATAPGPARAPELGLPAVRAFSPKEYGGGSQNWDLVRAPSGLVYVANAKGVLEFDGQGWRTIPLPGGQAAKSLAVGGDGTVYVGGIGELGRLAPDAQGRLRYISLLDRVPAADRGFGALWYAHAAPEGVYFCAYERLLRVRGGEVQAWKPASSFRRSFLVGGRLYVRESTLGLLRLEGEELRPVPGGEAFRDLSVAGLLQWPGEEGLVAATLDQGLWSLQEGRAVPLKTASDALLRASKLQCGRLLRDGTLALGTRLGGLALLDRDGRLRFTFGPAAGLFHDDVKAVAPTPEGDLWILQTRGLCLARWPWAASAFDPRTGLEGSVLSLARHQGVLYAGTSLGTFALGPGGFRKVEGTDSQTWCLLSVDGSLLAACQRGVFEVSGGRAKPLLATPFSAGFLLRSRRDPDRIYVGTENGIRALRRRGGRWADEGLFVPLAGDVQSLVEAPDGRLWAGTDRNGLWRVTPLTEGGAGFATERSGAAPERADCRVFEWAGRIALVEEGRLQVMDGAAFRPLDLQPFLGPGRSVEQVFPDAQGGLWLAWSDPAADVHGEGLLRPDGQGGFTWRPLRRPPDFTTVAHALRVEEDGTAWVGHFQGLVRLGPAGAGARPPAAAVRRVATPGGELLFGGAGDPGEAVVPWGRRGLRFEFAAPGAAGAPSFRTRMEGEDPDWSPWRAEAYRDYTNLPAGRYVFRVQARDEEGREGPEAAFRLEVRPPWYLTRWARLLALGIGGAAAYGLLRLRTRILERRNRELEARVQEATRELREANRELHELNEQKTTFLGVVAHDLKGPLHGIVLAAEAFERDPRETTRLRGRAIRKEGVEMCALIDRFLSVAAMESGEMTARIEVLDLAQLAQDAVEARRGRAEEKGIAVGLEVPGPVRVLGDRMYVREVLDNLLTNALKFSPRGARVGVVVALPGRVSVEDQGPGLTDLDLKRLFGRFMRLSAKPTAGESSSGLGLFIARRMVEDMGGRVWAERAPGGGAVFRVELPAASPQPVPLPHEGRQ